MKDPHGADTLESMSQAQWYNHWVLNKFEKYLKGDILEVGCGIGNFTKYLVKYGHVWALDINSEYVQRVNNLKDEKIKAGLGDIEKGKYFFGEKKFDSIICLNVLEHIEDDVTALINLKKLLKEGGFLILILPAHQFLFGEIDKSIGHYRRYTKVSIKKMLLDHGFKLIKVRILNMLGGIGWWFASKILSNKTVDSGKIQLFNILAPIVLPLEDLIEPPIGTSILVISQK